jgi:TolB protein
MPPRPTIPFVAVALTCVTASFAEEATMPLVLEEFIGGTGRSAAGLVTSALERNGRVNLKPAPGAKAWTLRAGSSAGRIDGALVSPQGEVMFNRHYDLSDMTNNANAFADDIVEALTGDPGIAFSRIAFVSDRTGNKEIYICDSDGGRIEQITRDRTPHASPSLGPGALLMACTSYTGGFPDVWTINLDDGERKRIVNAPGTNSGAAFSRDGSRIALSMTHHGDPEIYITTVNGGRSRRVTESQSIEFSPAWAPDGERIVFCSDATGAPQLYIVPRRGGDPQRLETGFQRCTDPDWSPDGKFIAFTAHRGAERSVALYDMVTGRTSIVLRGATDPSWAPDSRHLAAVKGGDLHIHHIKGRTTRLVSGMGRISEPSWSK